MPPIGQESILDMKIEDWIQDVIRMQEVIHEIRKTPLMRLFTTAVGTLDRSIEDYYDDNAKLLLAGPMHMTAEELKYVQKELSALKTTQADSARKEPSEDDKKRQQKVEREVKRLEAYRRDLLQLEQRIIAVVNQDYLHPVISLSSPFQAAVDNAMLELQTAPNEQLRGKTADNLNEFVADRGVSTALARIIASFLIEGRHFGGNTQRYLKDSDTNKSNRRNAILTLSRAQWDSERGVFVMPNNNGQTRPWTFGTNATVRNPYAGSVFQQYTVNQ